MQGIELNPRNGDKLVLICSPSTGAEKLVGEFVPARAEQSARTVSVGLDPAIDSDEQKSLPWREKISTAPPFVAFS